MTGGIAPVCPKTTELQKDILMRLFREYYLKTIFIVIYFWLLLPYGLSQRSDVIVIGSFISLFIILYFLVYEFIKILKRIGLIE